MAYKNIFPWHIDVISVGTLTLVKLDFVLTKGYHEGGGAWVMAFVCRKSAYHLCLWDCGIGAYVSSNDDC